MTVELGELLLRGLFGTVGLGAIVAIVRAIYVVSTERGPRRRIEAVKLSQETLESLPTDAELRKFVQVHRDRELAALGNLMARAQKRATWWERIVDNRGRLISSAVASVIGIVGAVTLTLVVTTTDWGSASNSPGGTADFLNLVLPVVLAVSVVALTTTIDLLKRRNRRLRSEFEAWGLNEEAVNMALLLLAARDQRSDGNEPKDG
ncbi:hypothetical protein [Curtobacterium aurantiacum]|uniref:MotA/TolQ/ExbB proton channel domain-containing protein n=1 Tax=Curtobacterium aurantiacum TaxID=3236919 RepID=A0ABS5VEU0_9MICO|nr:hypothetical protein [Curtobacterium flaccumfaciens]MBT1544549.1 hypothetical protein [Curtobacterium flaccumfaciens pv. flaccumfaciens]MBT1587514.1 hypothetical protein [Curtobacterium flaccumfaciens pv. flaccumfaciens]